MTGDAVRLTEAERVAVLDAGRDTFECRNPGCNHGGPDELTATVERILTARTADLKAQVAAVEALADEWDDFHVSEYDDAAGPAMCRTRHEDAASFRTALALPATPEGRQM